MCTKDIDLERVKTTAIYVRTFRSSECDVASELSAALCIDDQFVFANLIDSNLNASRSANVA